MQHIEHKGWVGLFRVDGDDEVEIADVDLLRRLNGQVVFDEDLADFLQDGNQEEKALYDQGVRGGKPIIAFNEVTKVIECVITYTSPKQLTPKALEVLSSYSNSQLTDGFGSNPIDTPVVGDEYFVHLGTSEA